MEQTVLAEAYKQFLEARRTRPWPADYPISFDLAKQVEKQQWELFMHFQVEGDLRETINLLNKWRRHLLDWEIWMDVLDSFSANDAWTVRDHFVESLVFYCMMQPSSLRDLLATVATNALHHSNRQTVRCYPDKLDQDGSRRLLGRKGKETQVSRIGASWNGTRKFMGDLAAVDSQAYRLSTRNFRNLASHAIAPRFEFGYTNLVTRSIVPASNLVLQGSGTYSAVDDPSKKHVVYSFGGTPPLDLREVLAANTVEYMRAAQAFSSYEALLIELMGKVPAAPVPHSS